MSSFTEGQRVIVASGDQRGVFLYYLSNRIVVRLDSDGMAGIFSPNAVLDEAEHDRLVRDLRRARQDVFSADEMVAAEAEKTISACKAVLSPFWKARPNREPTLTDL